MNVKELIDILLTMPQDARVVTNGYEGGLDEIQPPQVAPIVADHGGDEWTGDHEWAGTHAKAPATETAVFIGRTKCQPYGRWQTNSGVKPSFL